MYLPRHATLASDTPDVPTFDEKVFDKAAEWIRRKKGFTASMLRDPEATAVIRETYRCLDTAVRSAVRQDTPAEVTSALESNAFVFSGLKAYHSLSEVGLSLTDDKGEIKTFDAFRHDVQAIHSEYNVNYLRAEYQHAVGSSEMALRWKDIEQDGDRYDLSYRTAADGLVRPEHAALDGTTLPPSDPFWSLYYPPNDWGCRCTAIQVPNGKYARSNSEAARAIGDQMTSSPKKQMFRFNAGRELKIFPDKHPYNKAPEQAKQIAKEVADAHDAHHRHTDNMVNIDRVRSRRSELREEAKALIAKEFSNNRFKKTISISNKGIKEWLNQPHKHIEEKNEILPHISGVIKKATYLGSGKDKHNASIVTHIFETTIKGDKSWIVVRELPSGECRIQSVSDSDGILKYITQKTTQ